MDSDRDNSKKDIDGRSSIYYRKMDSDRDNSKKDIDGRSSLHNSLSPKMDSDRDNSKKDIDRRSSLNKILTPAPPRSDSLLNQYNKLLDRYPLRTKMCTSFVVSAFGSALGSLLSTNAKEAKARSRGQEICKTQSKFAKIDWVDVFSYALHGGLINAPICHYWFEWLSENGPESSTVAVLVDQLVVQPPLLVLMFVCLDVIRANVRSTLDQFRESYVISKSITKALHVVPNSWRFWPFAVYFTFKYLKKKHYTVALNLCSVAWTVYLSRGSGAEDGGES